MGKTANKTLEMQSCIDACIHCHQICLETAMNHCLTSEGQHVEPEHFRLIMNCAEICQTSANFQLSGSAYSIQLCDVCAAICEACAKSCKAIGDMEDCVNACRDCMTSCRNMGVAADIH